MGEAEPFSISPSALQFQLPIRMVLSGSSGVGKSFFLKELIEKSYYMMNRPFSAIYYFYVVLNPTIREIAKNPKVILKQGFSLDQISGHDGKSDILCVIDDHLSRPIYHELAELFANDSRAKLISICLLTQNLYTKSGNAGRFNRDILVNRSHSVVFPCWQDIAMVQSIARNSVLDYNRVMAAYNKISHEKDADEFGVASESSDEEIDGDDDEYKKRERHSHLVIDFTLSCRAELRLRSKIYFMEEATELFWPV